ncbi:MAG: bifunctional glutamate N-acetyltransferase/amino-acid acetyltransferase ArgJ [Phycisphaeraceae bacterium]|nr:bifunctional glutamate N-acetyltransferase/amino-acid acetyltransferase ArgJ [Phycisphaeraceae bacterium]
MKKKTLPRGVTLPAGFWAAGTTCGIKESGNPDLAMIVADRPCAAAGVFTTSKVPGAPVVIARRHLRQGLARVMICNSGCANAATGKTGLGNAVDTCRAAADLLDRSRGPWRENGPFDPHQILPSSTGVIGPQLPMDKIGRGLATLVSKLARGPQADADAARAIMTTDLAPKTASRRVTIMGKAVHLAGIAKGSGMIAPNMATMLVFITTDAAISPPQLRASLKEAVADSFNRISVDQHTSPSDMVMILANGAAGHTRITAPNDSHRIFTKALTDLCKDLAYQVVRDGEGANRVMRVKVMGAASLVDADRIAKAVVDSPLVKTALHGADPNWGRIVTAAGYSGAKLDPDRLSLHIGAPEQVCVYDRGNPVSLGRREQRKLQKVMKAKEVSFRLDVGLGKAQVEWLGCDLSRQYVAINADYRT